MQECAYKALCFESLSWVGHLAPLVYTFLLQMEGEIGDTSKAALAHKCCMVARLI